MKLLINNPVKPKPQGNENKPQRTQKVKTKPQRVKTNRQGRKD
jgi:hypothetical protein